MTRRRTEGEGKQ